MHAAQCSYFSNDRVLIVFFIVSMSPATKRQRGWKKIFAPVAGENMFTDEELKDMYGVEKGADYVEIMCGCTRRMFGDYGGKLRVFINGHVEIDCDCYIGCDKEKMTPEDFMKHCEKQEPEKWESKIWVHVEGEKVRLEKTHLLKYYKEEASNEDGNHSRRRRQQKAHRDEYIECSVCKLGRRFHMRTEDECRVYHDAHAKRKWFCSYMGFVCHEETERMSRKNLRGCPRVPKCEGCTSCVCFGCRICRFSDCYCRTCLDFYKNGRA